MWSAAKSHPGLLTSSFSFCISYNASNSSARFSMSISDLFIEAIKNLLNDFVLLKS